jgi:hypothetical protein
MLEETNSQHKNHSPKAEERGVQQGLVVLSQVLVNCVELHLKSV